VSALRFRVFYFLLLSGIAGLLPLLAGRLEAAGVGGLTVGALMALLPAGRLLAAPIWAGVADRYRLGGAVLRVSTGLSAVAGLALCRVESVPALAGCMFLFSAVRAPIGSVLDAFVLQSLEAAGRPATEYGRIRLFGSFGFLVGVYLAAEVGPLGLPPHIVSDVALLGGFAMSFTFPWRGEGGPAPVLPALRALVGQRFFAPLLLAGGLQALGMSVYDTFYSLHVNALGMSPRVVGVSVAVGVGCEMVLMAWGRPLLERLGPARCLLLATLTGVPRWALTATLTDPALLVAAQALHGVGFGAFWLAGVQRIAKGGRPEIAASAQSLWAAGTYGVGALVGAGLAGWARWRFDSAAIFWMLTFVSAGAALSAAWLVRVDDAAAANRGAAPTPGGAAPGSGGATSPGA
jgi:PPP family 3-phenylpropionic acid transporter